MPFVSHAQARKFAELLKKGDINQATFDEWHNSTDYKNLPEHIDDKKDKKGDNRDVKFN